MRVQPEIVALAVDLVERVSPLSAVCRLIRRMPGHYRKGLMKAAEFQRKIRSSDHPVIVDLWAPWCRPCRAMEPGFKQISDKYAGQVEVLKINADESPEVLKSLGVMGIPTVIGFAGGKEIIRRTGMQAPDALDVIFDSTLHQRRPAVMPPAPIHRIQRTIAGFF